MKDRLINLGVDLDIGLSYCGDLDFYKEIVRIAVLSHKEKNLRLEGFYKEKDYDNYTILVHSIKSGAANLGAMEISKMAGNLEKAGQNGDYAYIVENHREFMNCYTSVMSQLSEVFQISVEEKQITLDENSEELTLEELQGLADRIEYFLLELELDQALEIIKELLSYRMPAGIRELLNKMSQQLEHFDVEGARECCMALKKENN